MPCDGTISITPDCDFPLANLPYGVFRLIGSSLVAALDQNEEDRGSTSRIGVALGNRVVDLAALHGLDTFKDAPLIHSSECFLQVHQRTGCAHWRSSSLIATCRIGN